MTFENIEHLLKWYFRKGWLRKPKEPGDHDLTYISGRTRAPEPETTIMVIMRIRDVVELISFRERSLIKQFYKGVQVSLLAKRRGYSEKTLKRAVKRISGDLAKTFQMMKFLSKDHL